MPALAVPAAIELLVLKATRMPFEVVPLAGAVTLTEVPSAKVTVPLALVSLEAPSLIVAPTWACVASDVTLMSIGTLLAVPKLAWLTWRPCTGV